MYTELQTTSNFSFLRGASHPEEMVEQAAALGYTAIAITDRNTLAGIVRAHSAAKKAGIRLIIGARLDLMDGTSLLAYPTNKDGYALLSALLTLGNLRAEKGECHLYKQDVFNHTKDILFAAIAPDGLDKNFLLDASFETDIAQYQQVLRGQLWITATRYYMGDDSKRIFRVAELAARYHIPLLATNDVHYHHEQRRQLQDVLTCVREKCTIHTAGFRLHRNAERHLKSIAEMERLFRQYPDALEQTQYISEACLFSLSSLRYVYPEEITSEGRTPLEELEHLAWQGARAIFGENVPPKTSAAIRHEMKFIKEMDYAAYFLTVYDIVRYARSQGILCQGRGSAANSTVCFCLGITSVNPEKFDLLFERFISSARNEPPDIDVDFEHERREEVIQYIYNKYGRDRAAIVATVTQERHKGAIRDVGKAMGLSADTITQLSGSIWEFSEDWINGKELGEAGMNASDPLLRKVLELTRQLMGFPRQLGQHTGGFIITQGKLSDLCPVLNARMENRTCIEWNKDDIEALGFLKIDVLALGMLTCIRKAFDLAALHYGKAYTLANIPQDDPAVYEMIGHAETIGVFQIESRAQQAMLPRLKPKCFYDLVIEVAIVRPGPIQGDMVHPYLRRRNGEEPVKYPSEALRNILEKTLGVPLFQEQAMKIAIVAAGFTAAEADALRRSMATFKAKGLVSQFEAKLVRGMISNGYTEEYAHRVFRQLEGFGSYGFPESHAAAFAQLVYVSSWLKHYHPEIFAAALLNSMPMGFYQPAQIVGDARKNNVEVLPVDVNHSYWDNTLEPGKDRCTLRLGFRQLKGVKEADMQVLVNHRSKGFTHITSIAEAGVPLSALEKLAEADAFRSIGLDRRQALWQVTALADRPKLLFKGQPGEDSREAQNLLPVMLNSEQVVQDYASGGLSLKAHPVSFVREKLQQLHIITAKELKERKNGETIKIAGLVIVRQRPGTAAGVCFITIEDETGFANLVVFPQLFDARRKAILQSRLFMAEGTLQREGEVIHVIAKNCFDLSPLLRTLRPQTTALPPLLTLSRADERSPLPTEQYRGSSAEKAMPGGRNFK
ncbi:MAG: error-prone DNA polymerase [Bacteroidota bacterium]|nr:error-prone DNA polymerase [Bacteroidota bacterium]